MAFYKTSFLLSAVVGAAAQDEMARMRAEIEALKSETARLRSAVAKPRRNLRFGAYDTSSEEDVSSAIISKFNEQWTSFEMGDDYENWKTDFFPESDYQVIVPAFGLIISDGCCSPESNPTMFADMTAQEIMWMATRNAAANKYWTGTDRSETEMLYSVTHDTYIVDPDEMSLKVMKKIIAKKDVTFTDCDNNTNTFEAGQMIQMANVTAYYDSDLKNTMFVQDNYYTKLTQSEYCE
jgi:hypothetical protein